MSLISTLNAADLMQEARKNLQPLLDQALSSASTDEQKALAQLHVEVAAGLQTLSVIAAEFNTTLGKMFSGYKISITVQKESDASS